MRNTKHVLMSGIVASLLCACAGDTLDSENPGVEGTLVEALTATTGFDQNEQELFVEIAGAQWADAHFSINGGAMRNLRMIQDGARLVVGPLPVVAGDTVSYSFTYMVGGVASDTAPQSTTLPDPWLPPAFRGEVERRGDSHVIRAVSAQPLAWADVHYSINGGGQLNVRMSPSNGALEHTVNLAAGDSLRYWFTYAKDAFVFDSAPVDYLPGAAVIVVDASTDSPSGVCSSDGASAGTCNLRAALALAQGLSGAVTVQVEASSLIELGSIDYEPSAGQNLSIVGATGFEHITAATGGQFLSLSAASRVTLADLFVTDFSGYNGGAISNAGQLTLDGVVVRNNQARCFGNGAMTAFAYCSGGAIENSGQLTLRGGTKFELNSVLASASSAAFVNAGSSGGAISNSGQLYIDGAVTFVGNSATANASAGYHPYPYGGASADASGGAIANRGSISVLGQGVGQCRFENNAASATASTVYGEATPSSAGGAISSSGGLFNIPAGACTFVGNTALTDPDVHVTP